MARLSDHISIKKSSILVTFILLLLIIFSVLFANHISKNKSLSSNGNYKFAKASVDEITYDDTGKLETEPDIYQVKQEFSITLLNGEHKGEKYKIRNTIESVDVHRIIVSETDKIIVNYTTTEEDTINSVHVYELDREGPLYLLIGFFCISVIIICGKIGIKSLFTLGFTGFMIIRVLLPVLAAGYNPLLASIGVCVLTITASIFIINGINEKSIVAVLGTIGGISVSVAAAVTAGNMCKITGLAETEAQMLAYTNAELNLDFKSIVFSAIIIGALGAIMDVSISMSSSMEEILRVKSDISQKEFTKSAMNVGKDIIGSMSNTLILAYVGGAFSLLFLLYAQKLPLESILNMEIITKEVITAFAGSLGLVWTVPLLILIKTFIAFRRNRK